MNSPYSRVPHARGAPTGRSDAPNAALLIDFDNVTMGMRSDLSKELKNLLNSDIIKGKVTVQRAYADWRRYPQYIVPLSENSVDLIFAPAYGSTKKNATDIRMAIDAMELVFIRPEIGTFILLTGDSDFSSLVLKLKEYGKYVIGVGIQESSSDILVQNCDEYYSYSSLTGLRKTTDLEHKPADPWELVEKAVQRMASRGDVMRSDRLKQVMIELDPTFEEGNFGFSKFSKFLAEAANRNLLRLKKLENGQFEVAPVEAVAEEPQAAARAEKPLRKEEEKEKKPARGAALPKEEPAPREEAVDPLRSAYDLLVRALGDLMEAEGEASVRDSDVKRRMLELDPDFDEGELGFGKFSRFLRQAHDHEVVDLHKGEGGTYRVSPRRRAPAEVAAPESPSPEAKGTEPRAEGAKGGRPSPPKGSPVGPKRRTEVQPSEGSRPVQDQAAQPGAPPPPPPTGESLPPPEKVERVALAPEPLTPPAVPVRLRPGSRWKRGGQGGPPPLLEGQVVWPAPQETPPRGGEEGVSDSAPSHRPPGEGEPSGPVAPAAPSPAPEQRGRGKKRGAEAIPGKREEGRVSPRPAPVSGGFEVSELGLPTVDREVVEYLSRTYRGVGQKTAKTLVEAFGADLFRVLHHEPERVESLLPARTAAAVLEGWKADLQRRRKKAGRKGKGEGEGKSPKIEAADAEGKTGAGKPGGGESRRRRSRAGTNPKARRGR